MDKITESQANTPIRLPRISQISDNDLMEINMSQEDQFDEIVWSEKEDGSQRQTQQVFIDRHKSKGKENTQKRRKRLMKYDSNEIEKGSSNIKNNSHPKQKPATKSHRMCEE